MSTTSEKSATLAIFTIFLLHGIMIGTWVPHIPLAKLRLDVGAGMFGVALLSLATGAVLAMPLAGAAINRYGSATVTRASGVVFCFAFIMPILACSIPAFMAAGFMLGACIGSLDVAMNAQGIAIEKARHKPIMSMLHGAFSLGTMLGAFAGALALTYVAAVPHMIIMSILCVGLLLVSCRYLMPATIDRGLSDSHFAWPTKATLLLGALCFLALMSEGVVLDWGAIMLQEKFTVTAAMAAYGYGFFSLGMALSRFTGDALRKRFGATSIVLTSALLMAASILVAVTVPSFIASIAAFGCVGLGIGNLAPVLFAGGGRLEPEAPGRGIAAVTTLGYAGFLAGPPIIGFVAEKTSLSTAFLLITVAGLVIALFARTVRAADRY